MKITKRQEKILTAIVQEYINSAHSVSSQLLAKKKYFRISPATIRIEMQKLTKAGFIFQPHTSAGRVPTDRGYRFFVDSLFEKGISEFKDIDEIEEILQEGREDIFRFISRFSKFLADISSNLIAVHLFEKDFFFKEGWEELLKEPEFENIDLVSNFTDFLESLEENIKDLKINSGIKIFIGRENPLPKAKDFSIISTKCYFPKEEGIISILGPKRMNYDKNISLINSFKKLLEKF